MPTLLSPRVCLFPPGTWNANYSLSQWPCLTPPPAAADMLNPLSAQHCTVWTAAVWQSWCVQDELQQGLLSSCSPIVVHATRSFPAWCKFTVTQESHCSQSRVAITISSNPRLQPISSTFHILHIQLFLLRKKLNFAPFLPISSL